MNLDNITGKLIQGLSYLKSLPVNLFARSREAITGNKTVIIGAAIIGAASCLPFAKTCINAEPCLAVILTVVVFLYLRIYTRTPITQSDELGD